MLVSLAVVLMGLYVVLHAVRVGLAWHFCHRHARGGGGGLPVHDVTVLQPILSGDPTLEETLWQTLINEPQAQFVWIIDASDIVGQRVARRVLADTNCNASRVHVELTPPAPVGENPKVFKLRAGMRHVDAHGCVAVLDDDTVLPMEALSRAKRFLHRGDWVTGVAHFSCESNVWSALASAFINGNSLVSYLPLTYFDCPLPLNGMFYLTPAATLAAVGGFDAIATDLCDDLALAQQFARHNKRLVQAPIFYSVSNTMRDAAHYLHTMKRWALYAGELMRSRVTWPWLALGALPCVLPPTIFACTIAARSPRLTGTMAALLAGKALCMAVLRASQCGTRETPRRVLLEMLADTVHCAHWVNAAWARNTIRWRDKRITLQR